jgi:hypothetical protein
MWMFLGLITLVGSYLVARALRDRGRWAGESRTIGGRHRYLERELRHKGKLNALWFGVPCPEGMSLDVKLESGLDAWFRRFGISKEFQTGQRDVDDAVYIVAEDACIETLLRSDRRAAQLLLSLLVMTEGDALASRLLCVEGQLTLEFRVEGPAVERIALATRAVPLMHEFAAALERAGVGGEPDGSGSFARKALVLLSINLALAICAVVYGLTMRQVAVLPGFLDRGWPWGLLLGGLLLACMVGLAWRWLGRSSRAHLVIMEIVLAGSIAYPWCGHFVARELNGIVALSGPVELKRVESYQVRRSGGRRYPGAPYVRFFVGGEGRVG